MLKIELELKLKISYFFRKFECAVDSDNGNVEPVRINQISWMSDIFHWIVSGSTFI